ncbi:MAG: anti-sigma factor antagonist [Actinomycetota bacterium]
MDIFRVELDHDNGVTPRLRLIGEMDAGTIDVFRSAVTDVRDAGGERVILDLGELDFIDSTGLGALVAALKRFRDVGGDVTLTDVRPRVAKLLELTGLDKAFTIA